MCNCRKERNLFRSCTAEWLQNSARQVVGKVGLWHDKHAKRPTKSIGLHMELRLRQNEPVQIGDDLRCHDLSRRLQLYGANRWQRGPTARSKLHDSQQ